MKRICILVACFGVVAGSAVSCKINKDYDMGNVDVYADVKIEQEEVKVNSDDVLDIKTDAVATNADGNLQLSIPSETTLKSPVPHMGETIAIEGEVAISNNTTTAEVPDFCKSEAGAAFVQSRVVLNVSNSGTEPLLMKGKININGEEGDLPEITVPSDVEDMRIELVGDESHKSMDDVAYYVLQGELAEKITSISDEGIAIKDVTITAIDTRSMAPAAAGEFSFSASFEAPLVFPQGTVINYAVDFSGRLIDVSEYNITVNEYVIEAEVTNSIPFEITGYGTSTNGVSATLDNPIKAGTKDHPVKTAVTVSVVSKSDVLNLEGATLHLTLSAPGVATLENGQKLDIDLQKVKFRTK